MAKAMIMPRIWPLNKIPDEFTKEVSENTRLEKLPEGNNNSCLFKTIS
jgi:nucleoside recognition membrane protein YjiH